MIESLLEKNFFPPELEQSLDLKKQELILRVNDWQFFRINKDAKQNLLDISLTINIDNPFFGIECSTIIINLVESDNNMYLVRQENTWNIFIKNCRIEDISENFYYLYNVTLPIRSFNYSQLLPCNFKRGYLQTYFEKYLCLNGLQLRQTNDINFARSIEAYLSDTSIALKLKDQDLYIISFNHQGYIKLDNRIQFFDCMDARNPAIKYKNYFLSARDSITGNFSLMPKCLAWERFNFIND